MNACNNLRSTYVEEFNKSNSSGNYIAKAKELSYSNSFDMDHLKTVRNKYLHRSASVTKFGLGPKVGGITDAKDRKRNVQNG